jgi:hypothetical protein
MREKFHPMVFIATLTVTLCTHNTHNQNQPNNCLVAVLLGIYWVWGLVTFTNEINGVDGNACNEASHSTVRSPSSLEQWCECFTPKVLFYQFTHLVTDTLNG